ncbi:EGF-like repeat and discoidin I-like domain-containing protein 3 [Ptychodera flava]|uniref:EGF-like repeat and discoidin I-like domain-containing protein 3 n=1 Tax=Ptychodera flava TaxID=63121 RepID=UPI003969D760
MAKKSMLHNVLLFGLLATFVGTYCAGQHACESGWDYFNGKCYYAYQSPLYTYQEARTVCIALGGSLAKINNLEEDLWLRGYSGLSANKFNMWLGANDIEQEGVWKWEDGTQITYSDWYANQPNNGGGIEDCLHFYKEWDGKWNDARCNYHMGYICEKTISDSSCGAVPVGIENGVIPDSQMTASSAYNSDNMPYQGRLNYAGPGSHAWCARLNAIGQWLQINLGRERTITKVATQGRSDYGDQWVKTFHLAYSDGQDWKYVQDDDHSRKVFEGNSDRNTIVYHDLVTDAFTTQYVRFYPLTWQGHMSIRVELYACT